MGTVVVSLDAELAWGYHDLDPFPAAKVADARTAWTWLLEALETYEVPATWAVVGHLLLSECDGTHADHPAAPDWFERDPGGRAGDHPQWFGPDLVAAVLDSPVDHELASHSFSHVRFGRAGTTRETAAAEVRACLDAADDWGVDLDSFVFPRNSVGHRDVLADHGVRNYRAPPAGTVRGRLGRLGKLVDYGLGVTDPPVRRPRADDRGLVRHEASQYLFAFEDPVRRAVRPVNRAPVLDRVRRGLDRATERDGVFHLWFHPNELRSPADFERVRLALAAIDRRRPDLDVATMAAVGERVRRGATPAPDG